MEELLRAADPIQNQFYDPVVAHRGIDHHIEELARRPFDAEVLADEIRAIHIHGVNQLTGLVLRFPHLLQAANFLSDRCVDEDVKRVRPVA